MAPPIVVFEGFFVHYPHIKTARLYNNNSTLISITAIRK